MGKNVEAWKIIEGGISAPVGFYAGGVKAGIKYQDKYDVALIWSEVRAKAAAVFTRNLVKAHPLILTRKHLKDGYAQAIVVNSGNANACMGEIGERAAYRTAEVMAREFDLPVEDVLVSSTGVIGQELPIERMSTGISLAASEVKALAGKANPGLKAAQARKAALAIMTTDTVVKETAMELKCSRGHVKLGIMAKGSGMIHPNMGTLLCFITTDARVESAKLSDLLQEACDQSFNMVTVDGDTSTNDMVVILANGRSGIEPEAEEWELFAAMVREACQVMAKAIARDGEGASKFLEVSVTGAASGEDARKIARSVCSSNLVKAAMYGKDANWGRILAAAGYSGAIFNPLGVDIYLNGLQAASCGEGLQFPEDKAFELLSYQDIMIEIKLQEGNSSARAWGCDLTHRYVDINANYRT